MTLTMTIVAPWGVWQCADHRLVWIEGGKATEREDVSVKHLAIRCPDGVALISYSGLGRWIASSTCRTGCASWSAATTGGPSTAP